MSKSKPLNPSVRRVSPLGESTSTTSSSPTSTSHSESGKSTPKLKSKDVALEESDGYAVRNHPEVKDDPHDDVDTKESIQAWDRRFASLEAEIEAKNAKKRAREESKNVYVGTPMQDVVEVFVAGSKKSSAGMSPTQKKSGGGSSTTSDEPRLHARERSSTVRPSLRGGLQRLARASMTMADFQVASLGALASGRWIPGRSVKRNAEGFPLLDSIPAAIKKALSVEYGNFTSREKLRPLNAAGTETELKQTIAKKFLSMVLNGENSDFDQSKIGSLSAINSYLSKKFGFKIEPPGFAENTESVTPRSSQPESDFVDLLVQDAVYRSRNYSVNWTVDLGKAMKTDLHTQTVFANTIEAPMAKENIEKIQGQRTDVSGTLIRDFPHSTYEITSTDGSIKTVTSMDEFVAFIGDPQKKGLPLQVSHFVCQNLGIFVRTLMSERTDASGTPQTVLKLSDGTPVGIRLSPKATYRLKKTADGSVEIQYKALFDTQKAGPGKDTARIWVSNGKDSNWKGVLMENASAKVECSILVHPDGTATMGILHFEAEGWNHVD